MEDTKEFFEQLITQSEIPKENIIQPPKYSAVIQIGNLHIYLTDKTFTEDQIKNMREYIISKNKGPFGPLFFSATANNYIWLYKKFLLS